MLRYLTFGFCFSSVAFAAAAAAHFDPPDLHLEYELHEQYMRSIAPRDQGTSPALTENYELQRGDSLWNLSQLLYGDGSYWPKVWAQNRDITNPHLIRPGYTLQFRMGSEDDTPAFRFSESTDDGLELTAANYGAPQIQIPPPAIPPKPIARIPKSFPQWQTVYQKKQFKVDYSHLELQRAKIPDRVILSAYVQDTPVDSWGNFLENESESGLPVVNQYVFVKIKKGQGNVGQHFLIVKDQGLLKMVNSQVQGAMTSHFVQVAGEIELGDKVDGNAGVVDPEKFDVRRALVLRATDLSMDGFQLIPGQIQMVDLSPTGPMGTATAQVVGSYKHKASELYGPGDIVFLNKGTNEGVAVGQLYNVVTDRSIRDERASVNFSNRSSGLIKIAKVSGACATGIILHAVESIQQGDRVQQTVGSNVDPTPSKLGPKPSPTSIDNSSDDSGLDELDFDPPASE